MLLGLLLRLVLASVVPMVMPLWLVTGVPQLLWIPTAP